MGYFCFKIICVAFVLQISQKCNTHFNKYNYWEIVEIIENSSYFYFMANKAKHIFKSIGSFLMDNFHQSQHLEYRLLKRGYILFQHEVIKQGKTFGLYVRDYLAEIQNFNYKTQKELSEKTRTHTRVSDIFSLRSDLIEQYFQKSSFEFNDYRKLIKEYNISNVTEEETQLLSAENEN